MINYEEKAPNARMAHPTPEHFFPLHVALGAAGEEAKAELIHEIWTHCTVSHASYRFTTAKWRLDFIPCVILSTSIFLLKIQKFKLLLYLSLIGHFIVCLVRLLSLLRFLFSSNIALHLCSFLGHFDVLNIYLWYTMILSNEAYMTLLLF